MHESAMIKALLDQVQSIARVHGAERIRSVSIVVGTLSGISPEHLAEHFVEAARGTPASHARLDITLSNELAPRAQDIVVTAVELDL